MHQESGGYSVSRKIRIYKLWRQNPCHFSKMSEQIVQGWQKLLMRISGRLLLFPGGQLLASGRVCEIVRRGFGENGFLGVRNRGWGHWGVAMEWGGGGATVPRGFFLGGGTDTPPTSTDIPDTRHNTCSPCSHRSFCPWGLGRSDHRTDVPPTRLAPRPPMSMRSPPHTRPLGHPEDVDKRQGQPTTEVPGGHCG